MREMIKSFILSILLLCFCTTTVTSYAASYNSNKDVSSEVGIRFVEDGDDTLSNTNTNGADLSTDSNESGKFLPKTGEQQSILLLAIGVILVMLASIFLWIRNQHRTLK